MGVRFEDRIDCPYYDEVYGCLDCYIAKCPYYEDEGSEVGETKITKNEAYKKERSEKKG